MFLTKGDLPVMLAARKQDMESLHEQFYRHIDESLLRHYVTRYSESTGSDPGSDLPGALCGSGTWFEAYKFQVKKLKDYSFVLSLPVRINLGEVEKERHYFRWFNNMSKLSKFSRSGEQIPLIPPFLLLRLANLTAWATPFGEEASHNRILPQWQNLKARTEEMQERLKNFGLILEDHIQLRCKDGIPFVCDFSDLYSL